MSEAKREKLSEDAIRALLALKYDTVTADWLKENFAYFDEKGKQKIPNEGEFTISPGDVSDVSLPLFSGNMTTTAGRYICNVVMLGGGEHTKFFKYINTPWDKGVISGTLAKMGDLLLEKKINGHCMSEFLDRYIWLGFSTTTFMAPSLNMQLFRQPKALIEEKNRLISENKEALEKADLPTCLKVTDELKKKYTELQEDNPAFDYRRSGASKDILTETAVIRGLLGESKDPTKFKFIESSLQDGIRKDEINNFADLGIFGAYSRGVSTTKGGYIVKQYNAAFGSLMLDEPGSDCHTKYTLELTIDKNTKKDYYLRYCYYSGKEYLLTDDNIKLLMGKNVKLRSPMYCTGDKICNKCMGELYYNFGTRNIGFIPAKIGSQVLNSALKNFHEIKIKAAPIDLESHIKKL